MPVPEESKSGVFYLVLLSIIAFVKLPIAFYFWIVKLVVRYNSRTLLLLDDSVQRNTMLETYLYLAEQDEGVKNDRAIILEALFRAIPGHGNEASEPFAIADLLKAAGGQSK